MKTAIEIAASVPKNSRFSDLETKRLSLVADRNAAQDRLRALCSARADDTTSAGERYQLREDRESAQLRLSAVERQIALHKDPAMAAIADPARLSQLKGEEAVLRAELTIAMRRETEALARQAAVVRGKPEEKLSAADLDWLSGVSKSLSQESIFAMEVRLREDKKKNRHDPQLIEQLQTASDFGVRARGILAGGMSNPVVAMLALRIDVIDRQISEWRPELDRLHQEHAAAVAKALEAFRAQAEQRTLAALAKLQEAVEQLNEYREALRGTVPSLRDISTAALDGIEHAARWRLGA